MLTSLRRLSFGPLFVLAAALAATGCAVFDIKPILPPDAFDQRTSRVPQLADSLGKGSLATVRREQTDPRSSTQGNLLEIRSPGGSVLAVASLSQSWMVGLAAWQSGGNRVWSPDSDSLVYAAGDLGKGRSLRLLDFSKGEDRLLYRGPEGSVIERPWWTAKSGKILFQMFVPGSDGSSKLWVIGANGKGLAQVKLEHTHRLTDVSRDGLAALVTQSGGIPTAVVRVDLATLKTARISPFDQHCEGGKFSPDAKQVVMNCGDEATSEPFIVKADGSDFSKVVSIAPPAGFRHWVEAFTPDGTSVVILNRPTTPTGLALYRFADKSLRTLSEVKGDGYLEPVDFTPSGDGVLVRRVMAGKNGESADEMLDEVNLATGKVTPVLKDVAAAAVAGP